MTVVAKHRLRGDGRIWVDRVKTKVLRDTGGWYMVGSPLPRESARVLYREMQDLGLIQGPEGIRRVAFHAGEGQFDWDGRSYHIASMIQGEIRIDQDGRLVARGHVTVSGLQLEFVATELLPIIRPLAWALVLRSEKIGRDARFEPPLVSAGA